MKAKDVAKILLEHPEMEVEIGIYTYDNPMDSCGSYEFSTVDTLSIRKKTKFKDALIILTEGRINYPESSKDFEVIS